VSATTVKLLQAAAEIAGGDKALAERLGIGEKILAIFMADTHHLPDTLLLQAVDIILADRQSRFLLHGQPAAQSPHESVQGG
jgi:hypothetical protein